MILADSDCIVDYLKLRAPANGAVRRALASQELAVNAVTAYELYFGEPEGPGRAQLNTLLASVAVIPLSQRAADLAAQRGKALSDAGEKLDTPDLLIAGTALELGVPLITRNVRHFGRVPGLVIQDPA